MVETASETMNRHIPPARPHPLQIFYFRFGMAGYQVSYVFTVDINFQIMHASVY